MKIYNYGNDYISQRNQNSAQTVEKEKTLEPASVSNELKIELDDQNKISNRGRGEVEITTKEEPVSEISGTIPEEEVENFENSKKKKETRSKKEVQADD